MSESRSSEGQAVKQETKEPSTAEEVFDKVKQLRKEANNRLFSAALHTTSTVVFAGLGVIYGDFALDRLSNQPSEDVDMAILTSGMGFLAAAANGVASAVYFSVSQDRRTRANILEENLLNRLAKIPWKEVQG